MSLFMRPFALDYIRVDPKRVAVDRVPHTNVPAGTFCEAHPGKYAERAGHVLELPLPLGIWIRKLRNTRILVASSGHGSKGFV